MNELDIELFVAPQAGCCGAVSQHLSASKEALDFMRRNIDVWWPYIERDIEAIVITASGCGVMVKEYGELLRHDNAYAEKARRISELAKDLSEVLADEKQLKQKIVPDDLSVAFHSPCALQHGQQLNGVIKNILSDAGLNLVVVGNAHLCRGSAGTYSLLQPDLSKRLLENKLTTLQYNQADVIATANVGCQLHLSTGAHIQVKHWIELLHESMR